MRLGALIGLVRGVGMAAGSEGFPGAGDELLGLAEPLRGDQASDRRGGFGAEAALFTVTAITIGRFASAT